MSKTIRTILCLTLAVNAAFILTIPISGIDTQDIRRYSENRNEEYSTDKTDYAVVSNNENATNGDENSEKNEKKSEEKTKSYIKYIDFTPNAAAMSDCANIDIKTYGKEKHFSWIELLAYLGQKYGGDFKKYKKSDLDAVTEKAENTAISDLATNKKLYEYYVKAYGAVLGGFLGEYTEENESGASEKKYGVCVYSPIAAGYSYGHCDDFGRARSFGYRRVHLGHDLMGSLGTPVIATESGYVEALGWNPYGGWRIGIRSFDNKRYYYYAHLRSGHPYADICEGQIVHAGEVIGYMGRTGYSTKEDKNNIKTVHLHWGLEIIFDPSQKDGVNQIWTDMYEITVFLAKYRSKVTYDANSKNMKAITVKVPSSCPD
ncbi:MAG: M23 family metallopeptidase [Eubacteriales bacterium]|nr:M23 family metallopeptidase [Eubacteriales bacterium]